MCQRRYRGGPRASLDEANRVERPLTRGPSTKAAHVVRLPGAVPGGRREAEVGVRRAKQTVDGQRGGEEQPVLEVHRKEPERRAPLVSIHQRRTMGRSDQRVREERLGAQGRLVLDADADGACRKVRGRGRAGQGQGVVRGERRLAVAAGQERDVVLVGVRALGVEIGVQLERKAARKAAEAQVAATLAEIWGRRRIGVRRGQNESEAVAASRAAPGGHVVHRLAL
mmetsp:Transcript_22027/g.70336  ORF Transcript_22027/g.70336 Transcript_22027/m.70336 type:complete len:226 (-) Transcript_22027:733-1410(-)